MLTEGYSNKMIAARLDITERAVEKRKSRAMKKMNAGTPADLLRLAITHELLVERPQTANRIVSGPHFRPTRATATDAHAIPAVIDERHEATE